MAKKEMIHVSEINPGIDVDDALEFERLCRALNALQERYHKYNPNASYFMHPGGAFEIVFDNEIDVGPEKTEGREVTVLASGYVGSSDCGDP